MSRLATIIRLWAAVFVAFVAVASCTSDTPGPSPDASSNVEPVDAALVDAASADGAADACMPSTCPELGLCGLVDDGCGATLDCGGCSAPSTCGGAKVANQCGCTPTTCVGEGTDCGTIVDGCGGTLNCGTCNLPQICGGGGPNTCGDAPCEPETCGSVGAECGVIADGCGDTASCGECINPEVCGGGGTMNQCGCTPTTCAAEGADCGTIVDGCGAILVCGSCLSPETCGGSGDANSCGCTPTSCAAEGADCGTIPDGCGATLLCGDCLLPDTCGGGGVANTCDCEPITCMPGGPECGATTDSCGGIVNCGSCSGGMECGANMCSCPEDTHDCAGTCASDDSIATCGDSCTPCPSDPNGVTTCDGTGCGVVCDDGYRRCTPTTCCLWTTEIVDAGGKDVGEYTSIDVDSLGNPHIIHYDRIGLTDGDLKYARFDGTSWINGIADGASPALGRYASMRIDSLDRTHVAYFGGGNSRRIRYAERSGGNWTSRNIEAVSSFGSEGLGSRAIALALDGDSPHVAYSHTSGTGITTIRVAQRNLGVWTIADIRTISVTFQNLTIHSMDIDANGGQHLTYAIAGELVYGTDVSGSWVYEVLDAGLTLADSGAIAVDDAGNPHIAYVHRDAASTEMRYLYKVGAAWNSVVLHTDTTLHVGHTAIVLDADDLAHISYATTTSTRYARHRSGDVSLLSNWDREVVANMDGKFNSIALDGDVPHISYYEDSLGDLIHAF